MIHYGDVAKIKGSDVPAVDVITFGAPCQDLSVAGKRAGMKSVLMGDEENTRSGLFFEAIRIIKEMRENDRRNNGRTDNTCRPRYAVYENVAGAFSSNKGEDFRAVLEETAKVADKDAVIPGPPGGKWSHAGCIMGNGWSIAWRLHDAQFWGVPQRRKRIALVADFGGESAPEILFERKGLSGDIAESAEKGQTVAGDVAESIGTTSYTLKIRGEIAVDSNGHAAGKGPLVQTELSATLGVSQDQTLIAFEPGAASRVGGHVYDDEKAGTVRANAGDNQQAVCLNPWDVQSKHIQPENGIAESLYAGECRGGGGESYVMQSKVYGISSYDSNGMKSDNPHSGIYEADTSRTLDLNGGNPGCNQGGMMVVQGFDGYNQQSTGDVAMPLRNKAADSDHIPVVCIEGNGSRPSHQGDGWHEGDPMYTLNSTEHHAVAVESHAQDARYNVGDINQPLSANMEHDSANGGLVMVVENHPADSRVKISEDGVVQTLSSRMGTGGGNVPMVMESQEPVVLYNNQNNAGISQNGICNTLPASAGMGGGYVPMVVEPHTFSDVAATLSAADGSKGVHSQMMKNPEQNFVLENEPIVGSKAQFFMHNPSDGKALSLVSTDYKDLQIVAYGLDRAAYNQGQNAKFGFSVDEEKVGTCVAKGPNAVCKAVDCLNGRKKDVNGTLAANARKSLNSGNVVRCESVVRRLTPLECERLQGFPDNWTNIGDWVDSKGKTHKGDSDSPRYKALGNSIALPFWQWMAERMMPYLPENPTMASLFDGIGGFPIVFSRVGCKPVWASEIEEFPIAVTKRRFPEE